MQIVGWLTRQGWIGRAYSFARVAVAGRTRDQSASRVTFVIERQPLHRNLATDGRMERKRGIVGRNRLPLVGGQPLGDPAHLSMVPTPVGVRFELSGKIAGVKAGEPWRTRAIAFAIKAMASEARVGSRRPCAAECDGATVSRKSIYRGSFDSSASGQRGQEHQRVKMCGSRQGHERATVRSRPRFPSAWLLPLIFGAAACKAPPDQRQIVSQADAALGKAAIDRVGCGACHSIPGVSWPRGKVGPPLHGLADRALIAGALPNQPDVLAAYIRNAPGLVPGSGMPAMPVTQTEARNIVAYLYEQQGH